MNYYRARYCDPTIGRFLSEDPLGFKAGPSFYAYVNNNPINANDPSGKVDVIYSPGSLTPTIANQPTPGLNFLVGGPNGATYPMGAGVYQRTVVEGRPFDQVFDPSQTSQIIDWGRSYIQNTRLGTGSASLLETAYQSWEGQAWDTKQFLPYTAVYAINGQAELRDYVGNAIWGTAMNALGISEGMALFGAAVQGNVFSKVSTEDPRDQQAIKFGYSLPLPQGPQAASDAAGVPSSTYFDPMSGIPVGSTSGASAAGGFLIYPNKPNTNQLSSVYGK